MGYGHPVQLLDFSVGLFSYMGPGVSMKKAPWRSSRLLFPNKFSEFLELSGVNASGDRATLREQLVVQHSVRAPEVA